jgi:hypothetical protein
VQGHTKLRGATFALVQLHNFLRGCTKALMPFHNFFRAIFEENYASVSEFISSFSALASLFTKIAL